MHSPRIENFNLLVRINFLNLFLYSSLKKYEKFTGPNKVYWSWAGGPVLIVGLYINDLILDNI
jgi:hypothetical protein